MKLTAAGNSLKLTEPEARITSGSAGTVTAAFSFDESWADYEKTAVFRCGDTSREVLLPPSGVCAVPWETLLPGRRLRVGVYGSRDGLRLPTVYADAGYIEQGAEPSQTAKEPTGTVYEQLLARVAVRLRERPASPLSAVYTCGNLTLDTASHEVCAVGQPVSLTRTEYAILKLLIRNPGQVLARSVLLDRIGEDTPDCTERSLKQHVSNLRRKLQEKTGTDCIEAVWGIGFRLKN